MRHFTSLAIAAAVLLGGLSLAGCGSTRGATSASAVPARTTSPAPSAAAGLPYAQSVLAAGGRDVYSIVLPAGQQSMVTVLGDSASDVDVFLYDESGNLIDSDTDSTSACVVSVTPAWSGEFEIVIRNFGNRSSAYEVLVL